MATFDSPSAFESVLKFLGRPNKAVLNLMKGNVQGAFNQVTDIAGDIIDAPLPGDWIKETSRPEDSPEFSDLLGGMKPGLAKTAVDIVGGIATDPLTFTGLGPITKELGLAGKDAVSGLAKTGIDVAPTLAKAGHAVRKATGSLNVAPDYQKAITRGEGVESSITHATQDYAINAFKDVSPDTARKARLLIEDVKEVSPHNLKRIGVKSPEFGSRVDQMKIIDDRLNAVNWLPEEKKAVRDYLDKATEFSFKQWERGTKPISQGGRGTFVPGSPNYTDAPLDYHPRAWDIEEDNKFLSGKSTSAPRIYKGRSVDDPDKFIFKYNELRSKGIENPLGNDDPATIWGKYSEQTAKAAKQAAMADELATFGSFSPRNTSAWKKEVDDMLTTIRDSGDLDSAHALETAFYGLKEREGVEKAFAWINQQFKPFATAGAFVPKLAFNVRNAVSSVAQAASNPEARQVLLDYAKTVPSSVAGGGADWLKQLGANLGPSRFDKIADVAAKHAGDEASFLAELATTDPKLADAIANGVIDKGFVSTELKLAKVNRPKSIKDWRNLRDAPQEFAGGTEQRIRMGLFESLIDKGIDPSNAARIVKDSFYDYKYASEANRAIRDVVPFSQFTMKAVPQFAKFAQEGFNVGPLKAYPVVPAVRGLYDQSDDEHPLPQWLANQPTIPLGSEEGKSTYLTSLGLPFEVAGSLPNLSDDLSKVGRQTEQGIISQLNPALKFAYSAFAGHDPYFGSDFASYDKTPAIVQAMGAPETSGLSRQYNLLASTGMIQPIASPINTLSQLANPDTGLGEKAFSTLGLGKIAHVDDLQALRGKVNDYLSTNPNAKEYRSFYTTGQDQDTLAAIEELQRIKAELKKRKKAGE